MLDINLLRPLIEQKQELAKSRGRFSFYISFTILLLLAVSGLIFGAKYLLAREANNLEVKITALNKDLAEANEIESQINNFNSTISQLKGLDANKIIWSAVYDNVAKSTPADIKLNQVALVSATGTAVASNTQASQASAANKTASSTSSAGMKLKITGETKSRRAIALFAAKLNKIGGTFTAVEIISSKKTESGATETTAGGETKIDFEINLSLKGN